MCTFFCLYLSISIITVPLFTWQLVTYACLCACLCHVCVTVVCQYKSAYIIICLPVAITYFQSCTAQMIKNVAVLWVTKLSYGVKMGRKVLKVESFRWRLEIWVYTFQSTVRTEKHLIVVNHYVVLLYMNRSSSLGWWHFFVPVVTKASSGAFGWFLNAAFSSSST